MKQKLNTYLDWILNIGIVLVVLSSLFLFWNLTTEFYDTPKFIVLGVVTLILVVVWALKFVVGGRVVLTRSPLDLPLLLLLAVVVISTFFAQSRSVAIFGSLPRIDGGLASFFIYILFYFVLVSNLKNRNFAKSLIYLLLGSGVVISVLSLLSYAGLNIIPLSFTKALNFTPTGSSFATSAILALLIPFPLFSIFSKGDDRPSDKFQSKIISAGLLTLFGLVIVLTGPLPTLITAALAYISVLVLSPSSSLKKNFLFVIIPLVIIIFFGALSIIPIKSSSDMLYNRAQQFPREIQLPLDTSWKISISAFRDSPFIGSGPGSYLFDFTAYKPIEFNASKFWNIRFDQSFDEYLGDLATLGVIGEIALVLLTIIFVTQAFKSLKSVDSALSSGVAVSGVLFFVLLALHASALPVMIIGLLILALFMSLHKNLTEELHIGIAATSLSNNEFHLRFDTLPVILLIIVSIVVVVLLYFTGIYTLSDIYHRSALNAANQNDGIGAYNHLVKAEQLNPQVDLYRTDLAQTNFALANAIATNKGPSQASPSGSLTDQDKQNIQTLLSQAINEGQTAVALSPNNPANWEILGSIYRQISGVAQNALSFALDSYGKAIQRDPLNPVLRLTVGGIYYSAQNYDMAIRFFTDAVNLKPDYANAYYNLALALEGKGDLTDAVASAQQVVSLVDPKSQDYQTANKLLSDLKVAAATESAQPTSNNQSGAQNTTKSSSQPPLKSADNTSALENKNLPNVLDLPKPDNISTPAAVQKQK